MVKDICAGKKDMGVGEASITASDAFMRLYNSKYDMLYSAGETGSRGAFWFDLRMKYDEEFRDRVIAFVEHRKDPLTSDRECAAFVLACMAVGLW